LNSQVLHATGASPTNHIFSGSKSGCVQCFGFSYEKNMNAWRLAFNGTTLNWTDAAIEIKKWYCISIVKEGSTITLYKNGISLGAQTLATTIDITSFVIGQEDDCVGGCFVANQSAWAHIDNFQVWDAPKTDCSLNINVLGKDEAHTETEINKEGIIIYPNPAGDYITVEIPENMQAGIIIISDYTGKTVIEKNIAGERIITLDINELSSGLFIVRLFSDGQNLTSKCMKLD